MKHVHLTKFILTNTAAFTLLTWAWYSGWVQTIIQADVSYMVLVIAGVFSLGWILSLYKLIKLEKLLNNPQKLRNKYTNENLKIWLNLEIFMIKYIANLLVILGLIGTIIGFVIAFSGADVTSMVNNIEAAGKMIATILKGMSVALFTTLVGTMANVWLNSLYKFTQQAANRLYMEVSTK